MRPGPYTRPQAGRNRPEWVVSINRNAWSGSVYTAEVKRVPHAIPGPAGGALSLQIVRGQRRTCRVLA